MRQVREKYERELTELKRELTVDLPKEIQRAVALGDLRENAEYAAALERQSYVQARIGQLSAKLTQLSTLRVDNMPRDRVAFGSLVTVRDLDSDEEVTYDLVLPDEGDSSRKMISVSSPIGRALVGKKVGDGVEARIAGELREWTVTFVA